MFSDLDTWLILEISSNHHFLIQIVRGKHFYYFWLFQFISSSYCLFRFLSPINLVYLCLWFSYYYYVYTSHLVLNTVIFLLQIKNFEYFLVIIGAFIWNKKIIIFSVGLEFSITLWILPFNWIYDLKFSMLKTHKLILLNNQHFVISRKAIF